MRPTALPWRASIDAWSQEQMKNYIEEKGIKLSVLRYSMILPTSVSST